MKFLLLQLYTMNRSHPMVKVGDSDLWLQWKHCNLEGLPPEREPGSMTNHGKIPRGQRDNLPEAFTSTTGDTYTIEDICELKSSR